MIERFLCWLGERYGNRDWYLACEDDCTRLPDDDSYAPPGCPVCGKELMVGMPAGDYWPLVWADWKHKLWIPYRAYRLVGEAPDFDSRDWEAGLYVRGRRILRWRKRGRNR